MYHILLSHAIARKIVSEGTSLAPLDLHDKENNDDYCNSRALLVLGMFN